MLQGVHVMRAAAGVARSIFTSKDGVGYWCGEGSGELKNVRIRLLCCFLCTLADQLARA